MFLAKQFSGNEESALKEWRILLLTSVICFLGGGLVGKTKNPVCDHKTRGEVEFGDYL